MAFYDDGHLAQVKDIAERQSIPPRFLEQIFRDLKKAGLVDAKRGPQGGYRLTDQASNIRIGDVLRVLEGPVSLAQSEDSDSPGFRNRPSVRASELVLRELSTRVEACFDGVTLADICRRAEQLGVQRPGEQRQVYVI
jgi:Rrf2 family protein